MKTEAEKPVLRKGRWGARKATGLGRRRTAKRRTKWDPEEERAVTG